jgi:hypothetical protein
MTVADLPMTTTTKVGRRTEGDEINPDADLRYAMPEVVAFALLAPPTAYLAAARLRELIAQRGV